MDLNGTSWMQASFKGSAIHASQFTSAANYIGKKALVVGSGTSG
jgi:cation diffusion facilitator CzcD-associated flavoprotein CzcO